MLTYGACTAGWKTNFNCILGLTIIAHGVTVQINGKQVSVNGEINPDLPYRSRYIYIKRATLQFTMIEGFGFRVLFNPNHQFYLKLYPFFENKVREFFQFVNFKNVSLVIFLSIPCGIMHV